MRTVRLVIMVTVFLAGISVQAQMMLYSFASPRSMALGGVKTTGFTDAANMSLNPASLPKVEQSQTMITMGSILSKTTFTSNSSHLDTDSDDTLNIAPFLGVAWDMSSRLVGLGVSVSVFDSYRIRFPANGAQRYQGTELTYYSGSVDFGIGFIPSRDFAIGMKIGYLAARADWTRKQNAFGTDPDSDPTFDADWETSFSATEDFNFSVGMIWTPSYRFELGVTYRPPLAHHFDADLKVNLPEIQGNADFSSELKNIRITIPQEARIGFHWISSERLDIYMDAVWTQYSQMDSVEFTAKTYHEPGLPRKFNIPVDLKDEFRLHGGVEILASSLAIFRLGGFFATETGQPDYETAILPSGERYGVTAGTGFRYSQFAVEFAIGKSWMKDHPITGTELPFALEGNISNDDYFASLSLSFGI